MLFSFDARLVVVVQFSGPIGGCVRTENAVAKLGPKLNIRVSEEQWEWIDSQVRQASGPRDPRGAGRGITDVICDLIDNARTRVPDTGALSPNELAMLQILRKMRGEHDRALRALARVARHAAQQEAVTLLLEALVSALEAPRLPLPRGTSKP